MAARTMNSARDNRSFAELKAFTKVLISKIGQDNLPRLASSFSFFAILSIAPFLVLAVTIASFIFGQSHAADDLLRQAAAVGGPQVRDYVHSVIDSSQRRDASAIASILSLAVTFWSASNLFLQLVDSVNSIWGIKAVGHFVKNIIASRIVAFLSVLLFGGLLLAWLILDAVMGWLGHHAGIHTGFTLISLLVSVIFLSLGFSITIPALPRGMLKWKDAHLGGLVAGSGVAISKYLLTIYFARVSGVYGAAGGVVILLLWIYYTSIIYFIGIEVTYVYAHRYGSLKSAHEPSPGLDTESLGLDPS
jgi:membrane protein